MNGIKFKWIMPFSYKHYRQWKKGVTKTELHKYSWEDNYRENLCIQVHYVEQMSDQFRWYVMANYASYSTPTLLVQTMATKLIWSCSSTTKRFMQYNFDIHYNYLAYDLSKQNYQNVIFSEHVHFSNHCDPHFYLTLFCMKYCIYGIIMFVCMPIWMFTFTPPRFEPTDTHSLNLLFNSITLALLRWLCKLMTQEW